MVDILLNEKSSIPILGSSSISIDFDVCIEKNS